MNDIMTLVRFFWEWTGCPEVQWGKDIATIPIDPVVFPYLHEMQSQCFLLINQKLTKEELDAFLICMAVDEESEFILDALKKLAQDDFLEVLLTAGVKHPQRNARWQMAEVLQRNVPNREIFVRTLLADSQPYVRKRMENVLKSGSMTPETIACHD